MRSFLALAKKVAKELVSGRSKFLLRFAARTYRNHPSFSKFPVRPASTGLRVDLCVARSNTSLSRRKYRVRAHNDLIFFQEPSTQTVDLSNAIHNLDPFGCDIQWKLLEHLDRVLLRYVFLDVKETRDQSKKGK